MVYVHDQIKQKQKNIKVVGEVIKSFDSWRTIYAHEIKKKLRVPRGQPLQISFTSYAGPRPHSSSQGFSLAASHLIEAPIGALNEAWIENKAQPPGSNWGIIYYFLVFFLVFSLVFSLEIIFSIFLFP